MGAMSLPLYSFAIPWTVACQAPLSMGFSRQEYWSGLPCPPPGRLPDLGIKPSSFMSLVLAVGFFITSTTWEALCDSVAAAAAAAKLLQSCPTLCDPIDGSPPGSASLGFSRQECWSGLPFPSPMHESEQ